MPWTLSRSFWTRRYAGELLEVHHVRNVIPELEMEFKASPIDLNSVQDQQEEYLREEEDKGRCNGRRIRG